MNLNNMETKFKLILSFFFIFLLITNCNYDKKNYLTKPTSDTILIKWVKAKMNLDLKMMASEGFKKMYVYLVIQSNQNDTINLPVIIPNSKYRSYFSLIHRDSESNLVDTNHLNFYYNKNFYSLMPGQKDTLVLECSLETFNIKESILRSAIWAGEGDIMFLSKDSQIYKYNSKKIRVEKVKNFLLEVHYK